MTNSKIILKKYFYIRLLIVSKKKKKDYLFLLVQSTKLFVNPDIVFIQTSYIKVY